MALAEVVPAKGNPPSEGARPEIHELSGLPRRFTNGLRKNLVAESNEVLIELEDWRANTNFSYRL